MFIDDRTTPVLIRLAGVLDWSTHGHFLSAMEELSVSGVLLLTLDAGELNIGDTWGARALILFQQRIRECGGSLTWEGFDSDRTGRHTSAANERSSYPLRIRARVRSGHDKGVRQMLTGPERG